jgi:UV DNA damage endonuclease
VNTQLPSSARTLRLANATPERLLELTAANLDALEAVLRWNRDHGIEVFRLTSNLVPLASHPANTVRWWETLAERFAEVGRLMRGMSISTHPGQYTVLSSQRPDVVVAAIAELEYHARLLDALGLDLSHKIVLHVGSGHADPESAFARFAAAFGRLGERAAARLVLENDERWPLELVLELADRLDVPVVLDVFHHELAPSLPGLGTRELAVSCSRTWRTGDGRQEVHFSTQAKGRRPGAHAETLDEAAFAAFAREVGDLPLDCIVEVKDKERSALRAQALLR